VDGWRNVEGSLISGARSCGETVGEGVREALEEEVLDDSFSLGRAPGKSGWRGKRLGV